MRAVAKSSELLDEGAAAAAAEQQPPSSTTEAEAGVDGDETFRQALEFSVRTYEIVLRRWGDKNTLSCIHTTLVFVEYLTRYPEAMSHVQDSYPWKLTSMMLNYLLKTAKTKPRMDGEQFPGPEKGEAPYPLPEDYAMRGLVYAEDFFPDGWFENDKIDDDDRYLEPASKTVERQERILWIGRRVAISGKWLTWDAANRRFGVSERYDVALADLPDDGAGAMDVDADVGRDD